MTPDITLLRAHHAEDDDEETSYDIVLEDGMLVGTLCIWENGGETGVAGLDIAESLRGQGLGRAAMESFFRRSPSVSLLHGESVFASEGFWAALGCRWLNEGDAPYRPFILNRDAVFAVSREGSE